MWSSANQISVTGGLGGRLTGDLIPDEGKGIDDRLLVKYE